MIGLMILASTPFAFEGIRLVDERNVVPVPGILMPVFGILMVIFFAWTVVLVVIKFFHTVDVVRRQWLAIGAGLLIAYSLLIFFVFLRVIGADDTTFVPYSPLFILPIFIGASLAILRHHLFNVKVIATEVVSFLLIMGGIIQVVLAETLTTRILSLALFGFVLTSTILLIKSVLKEVEQREQLQKLSEDLKAANVQLEELSQSRVQLLSIAAHDVKSPLGAIKQYVSLILDKTYGGTLLDSAEGEPASITAEKTQVKETLFKVRKDADKLLVLINTLLDFRKIVEGRMDYKLEPMDIVSLVSEVVGGLKQSAAESKLELSLSAPSEKIMIQGDADKLKQEVLQNLIGNAIKYTPKGFVKVAIEKKEGSVVISVKDSGLGISQELLPHLFGEFIREERIKKLVRGTGLGLFIARKVVEAHGGKIWAESDGEGKGSTFSVVLPMI